MKKIATVTFHMAWNYGAILQTFALQKAIQGLGYESAVWNYDCKKISDCYSLIDTHRWKNIIKSLLLYRQRAKKDKNFRQFISKNIQLSEDITKENQEKLASEYDAFIVGSDQVWNYRITGGDSAYFLNFAPQHKRLSYAASLGVHGYPEEWKQLYREHLQQFAVLSTREEAGAKVIENLVHRQANVDIDPVFLISREQWNAVSAPVEMKKDYVFVYMPGEHCLEFAKELATKKHMDVIYIAYGISLIHRENNIGNTRVDTGPDEFLTLLREAKYVVTGSFHATAFSLIFHKQFMVEPPPNDGGRITGILDLVGLSDCIYHGQDVDPWPEIDWQEVDRRIAEMRSESLGHLRSYIEMAVGQE